MRLSSFCSGLLFTLVIAQSVFASSSSNWLTKSLDYFSYEKCSYLEKSDLNGKFLKCINQPKRDRRAASFGDFGSFADYSKYVPKNPSAGGSSGSDPVKTGSTHGGGFGGNMIPDFASKYQNQKNKPQQPSYETQYYDSNDSKYPIGTCREEKKISNCLAIFAETDCLTEKEHEFFEDLEFFFRVRSQFLCRNASKIARLIEDNDCGSKMNGQDIQQQCYSLNSQAQFIEWQPNWEDGKVCNLLNNLAKCESDFSSQCGNKVQKFVQDSWQVPMRVTPCKVQKSSEVSIRSRRAATSFGFFDSISKINGPAASGSFMDGFPNFFKKSSKKVEAKKSPSEETTTETVKTVADEDEPETAQVGGFSAYNKNKQIMKKFKDEFGGGFPFKRRRRSTFMNGMKFQTSDKVGDSDSYFKDYIGAFGKQTATAKKSDESEKSQKSNKDDSTDDDDSSDVADSDDSDDSKSKSPSTASGKGFGGDFGKFMNDFMDWNKFMKSGPGSQYGKQPKSDSSSDSSDSSSDSKTKKLFKRSADDKVEKKDDAADDDDDDKVKDFSDFIKKIVQEEIKKSKAKKDKSESGEKSEANESSEKNDDADKKKKKQSLDDAFADYFKKKFGKKSKDDQKEKDKEDKDAEKKKDEAEREAERKKDEAERLKEKAEREAERKKDEAEREAERKKDEAERKKQKAEYEKEMAAYYKEKYVPKKVSSTTAVPTTPESTEASAEAQTTTTATSDASSSSSVNTEAAQVSAETTTFSTSGDASEEPVTKVAASVSSENSSEANQTTTESTA